MKYFVLLRGINVGGNKKVVMKELKHLFENKGYSDVSTILNTGNILLQSNNDIERVEKDVAEILGSNFEFDIPFIVYRGNELIQFLEYESVKQLIQKVEKGDKVIFTFARHLKKEELHELEATDEFELIHADSSIICLYFSVNKVGTPAVMKVLDKALQKRGTSRNLNTIKKMIKKLDEL